jgi:hypothetical protein
MAQDTVQVNLKGLFFALVVVIALIVFGIGALTNGDPFWFLPFFNETPKQIIVYNDGCSVKLVEGQVGFAPLNAAIQQALVQYEGYNSTMGISPESLAAYHTQEQAVEVMYAKPVTIHTLYRFGHPDMLFIPLSGYLADAHSVFGGKSPDYWAGGLRLKTIEPIQRAAEQIGCAP